MKRILALILAILMVVGTLVACDTDENTETEKPIEKQTEKETEKQIEKETEKESENQTEKETEKENKNQTEKETEKENENGTSNNTWNDKCTHVDEAKDHACDKCGVNMGTHADSANDGDHLCEYCSKVASNCEDSDKNHSCNECGANVGTHADNSNDGNHTCDYGCGATLTSCNDADKDHECDECGANMGIHADSTNDGDHLCEYCGKNASSCNDANKNHYCDECNTKISSCNDSDKDHHCDECGANIGIHSDSANDGDHTCDYGCGATLTSCTDADLDHDCDECGASMGTHADSANDGDHICDYGCGATLTSCTDADLDHECDECGATTSHNYENGYCTICGEKEWVYTRNGNKITFGSYPQSEVTDSSLTATLNSKAGTLPTSSNSQAWTSYGYYINGSVSNFMWYIDVEQGGEKYRGVYFTSYRYDTTTTSSNTYQDDNGYTTSTVYWFKYEPISWTILSENTSDGTALILCDMIIDSQEYYINSSSRTIDGKTVYANNYAHSTIRKWLNETFYNTAFSELQKQIILTTTVDNSVASTGYSTNQFACENTQEKIFLLSAQEVTNTAYGFASSTSTYDTARQKKTTDYAQAQGAYTDTSTDYAGNGYWWLRSPNLNYHFYAREVNHDGGVRNLSFVYCTYYGVVPALQIRL